MRICRFNEDRLGIVKGDEILDVSPALQALPPVRWPIPHGDRLIANWERVRSEAERLCPVAPRLPLKGQRLNSPVANPSKIIAAPGNYKLHVELDTKDPAVDAGMHRQMMTSSEVPPTEKLGLFLKANTSLVGAAEGVTLPAIDRRVDHEVELALVIGREGRNISAADALGYVMGYSIGLDMSFRGVEDRSFRKSADSFTVLGPYLVTADEIKNPENLELALEINGSPRQKSNTSLLMVGLGRMIEIASSIYTLYPGDIILTGTPEGVGPVAHGDHLVATCEGIGTLTFDVKSLRA
ncbi:MAG: 2-hydroxyhepta-2,4-diene,7-dioate isomerase [Ramlibacter sp.]|nr:2-hydroxyhepta-2,4-diene,7-dioate isomerase [Ramlibacter sp.]